MPSQYGTKDQILAKVNHGAARANSDKLPNGKTVVFCDNLDDCQSAVGDLMAFEEVGMYCEGNLADGRDGHISIINVSSPEGDVYIFDIMKMGRDAFDKGGY